MRHLGLAILLSILALWWLTLDSRVSAYNHPAPGVMLAQVPAAGAEEEADSIEGTDTEYEPQPTCILAEVRMSQTGSVIDTRLEPLRAKLARPPFSMFSSFALISTAPPGESITLSTGAELRFVVTDVSGQRLALNVEGDDANGKAIARIGMKIDVGDSALIGMDSGGEYMTVVWVNCSVNAQRRE